MDRVHASDDWPLDPVGYVAVAVLRVGEEQMHTGILHRNVQSGSVSFLHLRGHAELEDRPADSLRRKYFWVTPRAHPARLRQVAARCRQIARANGRFIPYGFSPPTDCFDEMTFRFLIGGSSVGLTCATFVLAVFELSRLRLVMYDSWPSRDDDSIWQRRILEMLRHSQTAPPEHIRSVEEEIGSARYRPVEVAAAAAHFPPSVEFEAMRGTAQDIEDRLRAT